MGVSKTNAIRLLDRFQITYELLDYPIADGRIDGSSVCEKLGLNPAYFFKTLVLQSPLAALYVVVIPVLEVVDLKKVAKALGQKSLKLLPVQDLFKTTGYHRGGCTPLGMKSKYPVFVDQSVESIPNMVISAGKIGVVMRVETARFLQICEAEVLELTSKSGSIPPID